MFEKLDDLVGRFREIESVLSSGSLPGQELIRLSKERAAISEIVSTYLVYKRLTTERNEAKALLSNESDAELRSLAKAEVESLEPQILEAEQQLKFLTLPKDPNDEKNVILEIRAGTGGEEAALFAADLMRMYSRFADRKGWKFEVLSSTLSATGGFKEVVLLVSGQRAYSRMKHESGVHRVQRVPATEAQGRIHTSACTVAILPEADEIDVHLDPGDLEISTCRASGAGGQHVNKTDSAIRIVHKPTGMAVECQDERSQHKNKAKALMVLQARLLEKAIREQQEAISFDRKTQVGSGDRSERIRTYNFPQGRMTDHRINLTLYSLSDIMDGDLEKVLDALCTYFQTEQLKNQSTFSD